MSEITDLVYANLKSAAEKVHASDQRFYNIAVIPQLTGKLETTASTCEGCKKNLKNLLILSGKVDFYINDSTNSRKQYEQIILDAKKHLKGTHNITEQNYYTSLYTILGLVAGLAIGILSATFMNFPVFEVIIISTTVFLIGFRLRGSTKDRIQKKRDKQL